MVANASSIYIIFIINIRNFDQYTYETFEKCQFFLKFKEGDPPEAESPTKKLGKKGRFAKVSL